METFIPFVKLGLDLIASSGITTIVTNAAKMVTPENMSKWQKFSTGFATIVMGSMVASKAGEYIDEKVDDVVEVINAFKEGKDADNENADEE